MASTTISLYASTWYAQNDSVNHSSASWLRTSKESSSGGTIKNFYSVLQFKIPSTLRYKRITSAKINYYTKYYVNGSYSSSSSGNDMKVAPYIASGTALSNMTGATLDTYGTVGAWKTTSGGTNITYPAWRQADVTDLITANLYNNEYFTLIMSGKPALYGSETYYGSIGGIGSGSEAYLSVTYETVPQLPPTPSYPAGTYINENTDIMFSWAWNSSTESVQSSVQLEYKLKTAGSYTVVNLTQSTHTYILTGGLSQGTYQWRIKGTNDAGETSDYSDVVEFNVVGKPVAPFINSIPNRTLTEITWNTNDQNAFDVTLTDSAGNILIDDSISSSVSSYKPNIFLKGTYTVGIRTRNSTGLTSDWTYKTFNITAAGPAKPSMRLLQDDVKVTISVDIQSGLQYAIIRKEDRSGAKEKIVGLLESATFVDATFGFDTTFRYVVRAYATGGYTDSDPERIHCLKAAVVLETEDDEIIIDRSEETFLPYAEDVAGDMAIFNCPGRELPVVEHSDFQSRTFKSRLYIRENQKERLVAMTRKNYIFYRDYSGRAFPVAINPPVSFTRYMGDGYLADIEFVRVAEQEVTVNV